MPVVSSGRKKMVKEISRSKDGMKKVVIVTDKGESRTYHLKRVNGKWFGVQGYKKGQPILREFT
jgi:hypothetical protein